MDPENSKHDSQNAEESLNGEESKSNYNVTKTLSPRRNIPMGDILKQIEKSSLCQLVEKNSVGEFHLIKKCDEEHCLVAKQVFGFVNDLVQKCAEMDPKMEFKLLWTGSSAEGTKMWLPDEFDFLVEFVELRGKCEFHPSLTPLSNLFVYKECQDLWSNLCFTPESPTFSPLKVRNYIATLIRKAASILDKDKYPNINFTACSGLENCIEETKVGVNIKVCWCGEKYKKLMVSIDLTPGIPVFFAEEKLFGVRKHSHDKIGKNCIHVIPYIKTIWANEMWRPSFSLSEVEIMRSLKRKHVVLYKCMKYFRDVNESSPREMPSYHLKTFLFNNLFVESENWLAESNDFKWCFYNILQRLNLLVRSNCRAIPHFFLNYCRLPLEPYNLRWLKSTLDLLERSGTNK